MAESRIPNLVGGELPPPERPATRRTTRAVALIALAATFVYLVWRTTETVNWSVWWVAVPLLLLEFHAAVSLALFVFATWDTTSAPAVPARVAPGRVAVLIPAYNAPVEVLLPTVAAAVALKPTHETWVLDDGGRHETEALARKLGAHYLARPTHEHATAGTTNKALGITLADSIAVLDPDDWAFLAFLLPPR